MLTKFRLAALFAAVFSLQVFSAPRLPEETAYSVVIEDVINVEPVGRGDALNATLKLSAEVPNSDATVVLRGIGKFGTDVLLKLLSNTTTPGGKPTRLLDIQWSPSEKGFKQAQLVGTLVQLFALPIERKIVDVTNIEPVGERDFYNAKIVFDGAVSNTDSTLVVDLGQGAIRHHLLSEENTPTGRATTKLDVQWTKDQLAKLVGKTVRVYSPELPELR